MLDDFDNLIVLKTEVKDATSLRDYLENGKAGPLGRPISKLSFLIDDNGWPSSPENFKRTNLLIHLLVGILIFSVVRMLLRPFIRNTQADWLALTVTALWLVHPFQVSTVSYVIQRMTQLSSLFIMAGIATHLSLRLRHPNIQPRHLVLLSSSLIFFGLLASFSKENGVLLPVYLIVIEFTVLAHLAVPKQFLWWRRIFIVLPVTILVGYLAYLPRWIDSYATRDFTLTERLLTQPVILVDYLSSFLSMRVQGLGLFQDDYPIYSSLFQPEVLGSIALLLTGLITAIKYRKRHPLFAFGVLWFIGGHLLESTTVSLELYFEHRNYLPLLGPLFTLIVLAYSGLKKISEDMSKLAPVFASIVIGIASITTWGYANEWGNPLRLLPLWSAEHPDSLRAQRTYAHVLASSGHANGALDVLDDTYERFPHDLSLPIISIDVSCRFSSPLRYELKNLAQTVKKHRLTDGLRPALQSLFENVTENSCRNKTKDLHEFVPTLLELEAENIGKQLVAGIFVLDGNLYIKEGKGNNALHSFQMVEKLAPSTDSMLRLAGFYILAKDFGRAREALELAQKREDKGRPWYRSIRTDEYEEKYELINKLQAKQLSQRSKGEGAATIFDE